MLLRMSEFFLYILQPTHVNYRDVVTLTVGLHHMQLFAYLPHILSTSARLVT